jgi:hypothetical protein
MGKVQVQCDSVIPVTHYSQVEIFTICGTLPPCPLYISYIRTKRDHWEDQGVGGRMGSEWILGILAWGVWIGFDWLRIGIGGELL